MNKKNIAIIPARGGSKRIPRKNIKNFLGKPIIYYSIKAALESHSFDTVMVSTDDYEIARLSIEYGAEVPFLRSSTTSSDFATTEDVIKEVILEYEKRGINFDNICCVYPTAPFVTAEKIKKAIDILSNSLADSIIPIVKFSYPPQRSLILNNEKVFMKHPEFAKTRSQDLEDWYHDCGQFYCVKTQAFLKDGEILTNNTIPLIISELEVQDIDTEEDWKLAEMKFMMLYGKCISE
ncbi:MAG: pseudaminic acid cytidylyltransferase [Syntrophomonadaceae bacterium]|nr:pseudaminic acid cytidylyltransferase [Syntrophomonadaceae bacterium]